MSNKKFQLLVSQTSSHGLTTSIIDCSSEEELMRVKEELKPFFKEHRSVSGYYKEIITQKYTLEDIVLRLSENNPVSPIPEIWKRAKEIYDFLESQN